MSSVSRRNSRDNGIIQNAAQRYDILFSSLAQNREKCTKKELQKVNII